MLPGGSRILCMIENVFSGLDLYCSDPAQHPRKTMSDLSDLSDLDRDLSDRSDLDCDLSDRSDLDRDLSDLSSR